MSVTSTNPELAASRAFASELVAQMTLAEKAGQMAQVEKNSISPDEVAEFAIGSILSGGGGNPEPNTPAEWGAMVHAYLAAGRRSRLGIPLLYGTDSVHGHSNVVDATIFPHNIGLGASGDVELVEQVYRAAAIETSATGARWLFAPTVAVALDPRWGRTYESFGDDPALVAELGAAAVRGITGADPAASGSALACLKHFVGDGGTEWGSVERSEWIDFWDGWGDTWQIDQGDTRVDEATLRSVHLHPYHSGLAAGALSVMVSYSSWNGHKLHGHRQLVTDVLKGELGFSGLVVSDWLGLGQLHPDPYARVVAGISAGIDMVMVPFDYRQFIDDLARAVEVGDLDLERIDDAVHRILTVKHRMGLFAADAEPDPGVEVIGSPDHRALARRAAAASVVVLEDRADVLPIGSGDLLVAGPGADDIGLQCGGWTIEWQGAAGPITSGTTILAGLRQCGLDLHVTYAPDGDFDEGVVAPVGLVVVAEPPYAEGCGDREDLALSDDDIAVIERVRDRVDRLVLVLVSGRPLVLGSARDACDAIVAAWLPGTEGAGVVDVLTGASPVRGRLPRPWPDDARQVGDPRGDWRPVWDRGHGVQT